VLPTLSTVLSGSDLYSHSASRGSKTLVEYLWYFCVNYFYKKFSNRWVEDPCQASFDAFVGEFLVIAISHKWSESPCQQFSTALSDSACYSHSASNGSKTLVNSLRLVCRVLLVIRIQRQTGRRPLSTVFDWFVGFCVYSHSSSRGSKTLVKGLRPSHQRISC